MPIDNSPFYKEDPDAEAEDLVSGVGSNSRKLGNNLYAETF